MFLLRHTVSMDYGVLKPENVESNFVWLGTRFQGVSANFTYGFSYTDGPRERSGRIYHFPPSDTRKMKYCCHQITARFPGSEVTDIIL